MTEPDETRVKRTQIKAITRTIRQLEKSSVPVPESLQNEKLELVSAIEELEQANGGVEAVYEGLLAVVASLGRTCGRIPHKELYRTARERKQHTTSDETFRKAVLAVLKEKGGAAHQRDILEGVGKRLEGKLTEADLDRPKGRATRWQQAVRRQRKVMINEGLLTEDSRSTWTLT